MLALISDTFEWLRLCVRSTESSKAENLFLRRQLGLYIERGVRPRRIDPVTRVRLTLLSKLFDWRDALIVVQPETTSLASQCLENAVAPEVSPGPSCDSRSTASLDPQDGHGKSPLGRGAHRQRIVVEARNPGLSTHGAQVHASAFTRPAPRRSALDNLPASSRSGNSCLRLHLVHCNVTAHPTAAWALQQLREARRRRSPLSVPAPRPGQYFLRWAR